MYTHMHADQINRSDFSFKGLSILILCVLYVLFCVCLHVCSCLVSTEPELGVQLLFLQFELQMVASCHVGARAFYESSWNSCLVVCCCLFPLVVSMRRWLCGKKYLPHRHEDQEFESPELTEML